VGQIDIPSATSRLMKLNLEINDDLSRVLERRAEENGFESTEAYCRTILSTVVEELEKEGTETDEAVEERLEDLGYLS
jgi:hypothetical protein